MRCPTVQIEPEDKKRFLKDPGVLTLEVLFCLLSVGNVLILYYLMSTVIPFPITVTWFQFAIGLLYARVLGECGREFPNLAYFVPLKIDWKQMADLAFPTLAFISMIVCGNILLSMLPAVALFPVAASFAICSHHITRFLGCGQIYRPVRWAAMGLMLVGFVISCFDNLALGECGAIPIAILYALSAAAYRGCFLERAMHTVRGLGNNLHNQQTMAGVLLLPLLIALTRERRFFTYMPDDFSKGYTWLMWGCLATAAVLPFIKNIVANRLIKVGGQPPWRFIELASMLLIFILGFLIFDRVSTLGLLAFILVLGGRTINSFDALSADAQVPRHPTYTGPARKGGAPRSSSGTSGTEAGRAPAAPADKGGTQMTGPQVTPPEGSLPQNEPMHNAARPFLDSDLEAAGGYPAEMRTPAPAGRFDDATKGKNGGFGNTRASPNGLNGGQHTPLTPGHSPMIHGDEGDDVPSGGYGGRGRSSTPDSVTERIKATQPNLEIPSGGIPAERSGGINIDID
eukprot:Blabericola_migrator_1__4041@NODE_222_length_11195_cov_65_275341_g188_i0_p3_GENE_NODE_222_length_11195_cov_65_275341_g188_i0NODE_222_length_11195_cov_65_275341_g188_i0_p3_ORF_typecomplete_len514_score94_50TPT/PF03151_16/1e15PTPS_related/PF10131_9/0_22DUF3099/PF11298_8/1e04DUF3099/PF11298_8/1_9e02DUF3099/PF11298_8/6_4e02DUF3099/PF11298_8/0_1DUF3099/PF11298_8/6_3e03_NODE_222_length_11195_cov_65_275341_g188_i025444085